MPWASGGIAVAAWDGHDAATRDLFLSNTVRMQRKLREAGVEAQLQVFEGMSHAYYTIDPFTPESHEVFDEIGLFLSGHLAK
jgi:epsilon-lactone hydrolase